MCAELPGQTKRILLVDDEVDILKTYKIWLELNGFRVYVYSSPLKALSEFRRNYYDILLLDIRMPEMTGFELYEEIRQMDSTVKVCFITSFETYYANLKETYSNLKDCCFVRKPISMDDLLTSIVRHLKA